MNLQIPCFNEKYVIEIKLIQDTLLRNILQYLFYHIDLKTFERV